MKRTIGSSALTLAVVMSLLGRHDAPMAASRDGTQAAPASVPAWLDTRRRDAARTAAARNPAGFPLRDHTNQIAAQLGFGADDRFELIRAHEDESGMTHALLQQTRQGVPVYGGRLIAHRDSRGEYGPFSDAGIRNIRASSRPTVPSASAISIVEGHESHVHPFVATPTASLFFYPEFKRTLASGAPLPPTRYNPTAPHSMVESINSDDVVRTLAATHLAWHIVGVEHDATTNSYRPAFWWVDAHDGAILSTGSLSHTAVGSGNGAIHMGATFETRDDGSCFVMDDEIRQFRTETEDFSAGDPVNCDSNNIWGNGLAFVGDANSPSTANWQSAMVDGHFAATVYWDMMDNIFGFQGPDDDYYSVNLFMHSDTGWSNAAYYPLSGNVAFGDGTNGVKYTRTDVIGHELGHAWNDHNSHFGFASALNESLADILGELTETYLQAGFGINPGVLGNYSDNPSNWVQTVDRDLANPNASGHPAYWYANIDSLDEHDASLPASRAFTFLANGSSPWVDAPNYSRKLNWGMKGLGLPLAAEILIDTHHEHLVSGEYHNLRDWMIVEAFSHSVPAAEAAWNAYAGINVGPVAPNYPANPMAQTESHWPESTLAQPQYVGDGWMPATVPIPNSPRKIRVTGTGNDIDYYSVRLNGNRIAVLVTPIYTTAADFKPYAVAILNGNIPAVVLAVGTENLEPQTIAVNFATVAARPLKVVVLSGSATSNSEYQLDIDLGTVP
ncbi:MAG TPA: M4 family metallopeptidase [Steroidobacteraceae bacterium]|nr:M4 family metallopeptidase [Steroidobacteraceae bacterium]